VSAVDELRVFAPTAMLGYGYDEVSLREGLRRAPHVIAIDAGSTDAGPAKLGSGKPSVSRAATKKDLVPLLRAGKAMGIPVIIGSAGGAGAAPHVRWTLDVVHEIAREEGLALRGVTIWADIAKDTVAAAHAGGRIRPLGPAPELTHETLAACGDIVAQMGIEPYLEALERSPDVIVAGRSYDPCMAAAVAVRLGFDPGLALHLGKIVECGALCATPGSGSDGIFATLRGDHFDVEPLNPIRACTRRSVAAHTFYEKPHPFLLAGPGGTLDLAGAAFEAVDARTVRVRGSRFVPSETYELKLESAAHAGHRTICIAGIRDPRMIRALDDSLARVRERALRYLGDEGAATAITFRRYGLDGVLGQLESPDLPPPHEVGLVIDVVSRTQAHASAVCAFLRSTLLHLDYPGRVATAGNLAFPFSPSDVDCGPVYEFALHHLMQVPNGRDPFPLEDWTTGSAG
jgi:hypothetical protein